MLRILQVVGGLSLGGTEAAVMNLYRHTDRREIQFDFVSHHPESSYFAQEIRDLGGRIYYVPAFDGINYWQYKRAWENLLTSVRDVRIVHSHVWSTAAIFLTIAKAHGYYTIAHGHSVSAGTGISAVGRRVFMKPLRYVPDYYMACSREAGAWLFGGDVVRGDSFAVLPNAVDIDAYRYDGQVRERVRRHCGVADRFVIGHVGSFNSNKNQTFILDLFSEVHKKHPHTVLWLIGQGVTFSAIRSKAEAMGLMDSVVFWGLRNDVPSLLQAMDVFVFPSKHESFGCAALEAEAAGVPSICSDTVPAGVAVASNTTRLSLKSPELWDKKICDIISNKTEHVDMLHHIKGTSLDIEVTSKQLEDFYVNINNHNFGKD